MDRVKTGTTLGEILNTINNNFDTLETRKADIDEVYKKGDQSKVVNDTFTTRITATNDVEILDSPLGIKTAEIKSIEGMSIKQVLKNGDFSDGTNGWTAHFATPSVSNKVLTLTVNSLSPNVGFYGGRQPRSIANRPYYISAYINPKYANMVRIGYEDNPASFSGSGLVANQWNFVSAIVIPKQSGEIFIFYHSAASDYAIGDTFRVADVRCIDLVDSGLTGWTKEQLDAVIPHLPYFEGIYHSNPAQLKSIGDNLLNLQGGRITTQNSNYTLTDTGFIIETKSAGGSASYVNYWYKLLPNTQYTLYWNATKLISGSSNAVYVWGSRDQHLRGVTDGNVITFKTDNIGTGRFLFYSKTGTPDAIYRTRYENILLQHAVNPNTDYKPYTEHVLELPQKALKKVGNVADEINMVSQTYTQRIGTYILDDTKPSIEYIQSDNNGLSNTVRFEHRFADIRTSEQAFILNDLFPNIGDVANDVEHIINRYYNYYNIHIFIDKQRLVPYGYTDALSDAQKANCFKAWLADNPLTIYYLLAEPIIEPLDKDYDATYSAWNYGLEQVFADGNPTIAQMDIEYPLDLQKQIDTNAWIAQRNEGRIAQNEADIQALEGTVAQVDEKADNAVPNTRKINGKTLSTDITLTPADIGAATAAQGTKADTALQIETDPTVPEWAKQATKPKYTKDEVGLGNVDNIQQATKTEFNAHNTDDIRHITAEERSSWNNKADLVGGKVPASQLPSYVDDVLMFDSITGFPTMGEDSKIYVTRDTNLTYRWNGTGYTEISPSLALGETSATAYRGDRGKTAYDHSQSTGNPHQTKFEDILEKPTTLDGYGITGIDAEKITSGVFDAERIPDLSYKYASISHGHTEYASSSHNHDSAYAAKNHNHDNDYASISHGHTEYLSEDTFNQMMSDFQSYIDLYYAAKNHNHDSDYASISHEHTEYASSSHNHSASNITSGTLTSTRLPYATSSSRGAVRISYSSGNLYIYTQ